MENLREEVQHVCSGTSDRFVPGPYQKAVLADILIAMRRFKNVVRWKEFWNDQKQSTKTKLNEVIKENSRFMYIGLNTILKPEFVIKTEKHGYDNLKEFLNAVKKNSSRKLSNADVLSARTGRQVKPTMFFKY